MGIDPSKNLYLIVYSVVDKECREPWRWFLNLPRIDMQLNDGRQVTFIFDKQKGLIKSFDEKFPR